MNRSPRVLIVNSCDESRFVLTAALRRAGRAPIEANRIEAAMKIASTEAPDVIVLDAETVTSADHESTAELGAAASRSRTPIVVLGSLSRDSAIVPNGHFFSKPYHYAPLIREIDRLLGEAA